MKYITLIWCLIAFPAYASPESDAFLHEKQSLLEELDRNRAIYDAQQQQKREMDQQNQQIQSELYRQRTELASQRQQMQTMYEEMRLKDNDLKPILFEGR